MPYSIISTATDCECCGANGKLTDGFCPACTSILNEIPTSRVREMWENRNLQAIPQYTEDEHNIVKKLWDRIPSGSSCWMSAFYSFLWLTKRREAQSTAPTPS